MTLSLVHRSDATDGLVDMTPPPAPTGTYRDPFHAASWNRYRFDGQTQTKYERAITDTICYLGWMSLKNSDHNACGPTPTATRRALKEAVETRKAADTLLAAGIVTLNGTWSNGIQIGPGAGFTAITHPSPVATATVTPTAARTRKPRERKPAYRMVDTDYETAREQPDALEQLAESVRYDRKAWASIARRFPNLVREGASCDMRYADGATCDFVPAPTPIVTPTVGQSLHIMYTHDNGTTTERVVDVQRLIVRDGALVGFRGYDRRRDRVRNYETARCQWMRVWDGQAITDMRGRVLVAAA